MAQVLTKRPQCATIPVDAMAKTIASPEQSVPATPEAAPAQKLPIRKLILFGVPVFLVQLVIVYFLITKFLAARRRRALKDAVAQRSEGQAEAGKEGAGSRMENGEGTEGKIYVVKDLIVNPAGTNGTRFLLTTSDFEVTTPEALRELESKDVMVRDALNTILTSKDLLTIVNVDGREAIRKEIEEKVGEHSSRWCTDERVFQQVHYPVTGDACLKFLHNKKSTASFRTYRPVRSRPWKPPAEPKKAEREAITFDFRLPHRLSKNQLRTFQAVHENFAETHGIVPRVPPADDSVDQCALR